MFGKGKVLKNGAHAEAVVLESSMSGLSNSHGAHRWKVKLHVHFPDGTTSEVTRNVWEVSVGTAFGVGEILPVRFAPDDPAKVEVDHDAMVAAHQARRAAGQAGLIAQAEAKFNRPPS